MKHTPKELRARKGETQKMTAESLGISYQTYCSWEKNLGKVPISKVAALCRHFNVELSQIKYE